MTNPQESPTPSSLRKQIAATLQNFAVCRDHIGGDEYMKSGDFEAHLLLTFGKRDTSKAPIDDLFDKAVTKVTTYIEAVEIEAEYKGKRKMLRRMVVKGYLDDVTAIAYLTLMDAERTKALKAQKAALSEGVTMSNSTEYAESELARIGMGKDAPYA